MSFIDAAMLSSLGIGYSIVGIVLIVPIYIVFKEYARFLDHAQLLYLYALTLTTGTFSNQLSYSWIEFSHNFYAFCSNGDLICSVGFALSFLSCLVAFLILLRILLSFQVSRRKQLRYQPVYNFFKPFFRWVYVPLTYHSLYFMIRSIMGLSNNLPESIVIYSVCFLFPIFQLVGYKCMKIKTMWNKWIQFFNYLRLFMISSMIAIYKTQNNYTFYYIVYGIMAIYMLIYSCKNKFTFNVMERLLFWLGEALMISVFSFFLFRVEWLHNYYFDLFFISGVLLMDGVCYVVKIVYLCKNNLPLQEQDDQVMPEPSQQIIVEERKSKSNDSSSDDQPQRITLEYFNFDGQPKK